MHRFKLRHILLVLIGLFATAAIGALGWVGLFVMKDLDTSKRLQLSNELAEHALRLGSRAGVERGLTMLALGISEGNTDENLEAEIAQVREDTDRAHRLLAESAREKLARVRDPAPRLEEALRTLDGRMHALRLARAEADERPLRPEAFMAVATDLVETTERIRQLSTVSLDSYWRDNLLFRETVHTVTEMAGRQRALLGVAIAEGRTLREPELEALRGAWTAMEMALGRLESSLGEYEAHPAVAAARERMDSELGGRLTGLRETVIEAATGDGRYPLDAISFYREATKAIESVIALNEAVNRAHAESLAGHAREANLFLLALVAAFGLLLVLLAATAHLMRVRLVTPLSRLERATRALGEGDYKYPLAVTAQDELGRLARAFEEMRAGLAHQTRERDKADAQRRAVSQQLRNLVENINDWVWETDHEFRYTYVGPQVRGILGYEPEEVIGKTPFDLMPGAEAERLRRQMKLAKDESVAIEGLENVNLHKDGRRVVLETSATPVLDAHGRLTGFRGVDRDVTSRRQAEEEKKQLLQVVEQTADIVIITNPDAVIEYVNAAFERITGYSREEAIGQRMNMLSSGRHDASFYKDLWAAIRSGRSFQATMTNRRKSGELYEAETTISPLRDAEGVVVNYVCTAKDVTEQRRSEEQILQTEKLASIGQLAAGVAHEINNPVGYINSNIGTLGSYLDDLFRLLDTYEQAEAALTDEETARRLAALRAEVDLDYLREDIRALIDETGEGLQRVRKIIQNLKDFSRQEEAQWQTVDLHEGVESTLNIVHNELKYKAEVVREYGDLPEVRCVPSQINQVVMNLLVNAAHAIEERGVITVRTGHEGEEVWLEVEDTGSGIPPEHKKRLFEPFFTTKPVGQGTGLGLSLAYGIVRKHGGRIEAHSEPGQGTRFRIRLPVAQPETGERAAS